MSIYDVCTLYAGGCLRNLFGVSMVSIGRHPSWGTQSPLGQTGPSITPENWYVHLARPLPAFNCSEEVFAMDILAESRLTFRQGYTVQPFAMVSGKQVCRYQDVSKESQTRGHCVSQESLGSLRLKRPQKMCLRQCRLGSGQAPPKRTIVSATLWRRGQGSAVPHAPQS